MTHQTVTILGGGAMGRGIAIAALLTGRSVLVYDAYRNSRDRAWAAVEKILGGMVDKGKLSAEQRDRVLGAFRLTGEFHELAGSSFVIEAVPELMDLKRQLFTDLAGICPADAIFASNTSSLSITALSAAIPHPERIAGMHFFNPAHLMKLVEVIPGRFTSVETLEAVLQMAEEMGKTAVEAKDTPGFIVNRIARPFYNEALRMLEENVADHETIDRIVRAHGFRMGPFELMDFIGHDVNYEVTRSLFDAFNGEPRYRPSQIQRALVEAGLLGRKTGRGFYSYE